MGRIVSVHSFRGGTGKSNVTANLAALAARAGNRVGVIDTDIQSPGIHVLFGESASNGHRTLNDFLWGRCRIEEAALDVTEQAIGPMEHAEGGCVVLIPSSLDAVEIARVLREGYDVALLNEGFQRLIETLDLDLLFIDTHPGVNEETLLSIAVSDVFLLILRPDAQDFQGTSVTVELARRLDVAEILVVLNKVAPGLEHGALRARVEGAYQAPVVGILPLNHEMARLGSNTLFVTNYPDHELSLELARVIDRLLG